MNATNIPFIVNLAFVRLSVLNLYHHLFGFYRLSKQLIVGGYIGTALVALPDLGVTFGRIKLCGSPGAANYLVEFCSPSSINIAILTFGIAGVLVDVYIYSIALFRLRTLQVKKEKKMQLMILFGFGLMYVIATTTVPCWRRLIMPT